MEILGFQSWYVKLKKGTPVFEKAFRFSENLFHISSNENVKNHQ